MTAHLFGAKQLHGPIPKYGQQNADEQDSEEF